MGGPATFPPPTSSQPTPASKPASGGLKQCWDLKEPQLGEVGSSEQAKKFAEAFKAAMAPVNTCLQFTKCNAVKEKHESMVAKRDYQYTDFQSNQSQIDPKDEEKAKDKIKQCLGRAQALAGEANKLKQETETSLKAWQAKESAYNMSVGQIEQLEAFVFKGVVDHRNIATEIQKAVNEYKFDDAVAKFGQLDTNLKPAYAEYTKQKASKEYREKKWNDLKPRIDKLVADKPPIGNACEELEGATKVMNQAVEQKDWHAAKARVDELSTRLEQHEKVYKQRAADKKVYDEKWTAAPLKAQVEKACGEVFVEGTASEKTKTALVDLGKAKKEMLDFATAGQYDKAKPPLEKLPGLLAAFEKAKKDDKANVRWFKPKFSVAETAVSMDMNVEKDILIQFDNAAELSPEAKFKFALAENPPAGTLMPIRVVSFETKQSTGILKVKSGGLGAQTFKFKVLAEQGKDKADWPVPQTSAVTVKKPEVVVTADTAKKYRPKDTATLKIDIKNINKAKEMSGLAVTCYMEADSVRSMDRGMTDTGTPASFRDPWNKEKEGWEGDNTYVVHLKADHAGSTKVRVEVSGTGFGAGNAGEVVKNEATFKCFSTLDEFKKKLLQTNAAQGKITGRITSFFAAIDLKIKAAKANFDDTYTKDTAPERKALGDKAIDFVWDKAKDGAGSVGKVVGIVEKIVTGDAPTLVAANLNAMSKEQLGATLAIKAAGSVSGVKASYSNLGTLGTLLVGKLGETLGEAIKTWQNWAETATPDKEITFDPDDGLYQACTIGGVRLVDLPLETFNPDDYEREMWKQWVAANQDYFKVHGADLTRGRTGNTVIIARLIYLRVDYPKNLSRL